MTYEEFRIALLFFCMGVLFAQVMESLKQDLKKSLKKEKA